MLSSHNASSASSSSCGSSIAGAAAALKGAGSSHPPASSPHGVLAHLLREALVREGRAHRVLARRYLRSWFAIDVISVLPVDVVVASAQSLIGAENDPTYCLMDAQDCCLLDTPEQCGS